MEKKKIYINKKCNWCLKNWYDGRNYITKVCDFHKEYNYGKCLKEIRKQKWDKWENRISCGLILINLLVFPIGIISMIEEKKLDLSVKILSGIAIFLFGGLFVYLVKALIDSEEGYNQRLEELNEEKKEWN